MIDRCESGLFVHLCVHSNYSMCWGANRLDEICRALKRQGQSVFALTDRNGLYGVLWARQAAQTFGLRFIVGAELHDSDDRAVALVKNRQGFENLSILISQKHLQGESFSLAKAIRTHCQGLVILSDSRQLLQHLEHCHDIDLYVLCIPGAQLRELLAFARQANLPPVAANDVYFVEPRDYRIHKILRAIDCNVARSRIPPEELARQDAWLKPPADMAASFPNDPDALANTLEIARKCQYIPHKAGGIFPNFPAPNKQSDVEFLYDLCLRGVKRRYGTMTQKIKAQLDKEINIIARKGFASHFLVVWDIVQQASRTCGRGSAAASLVSYLLGITHIDPLKHNLFFERFLHLDRNDPPDIDIDFCWDERDDMLDYIFQKYGVDYTAMVSNHVTFQGRAAIREVAKTYGLSEMEINNVSKRLAGFAISDLPEAIAKHPMFRDVALPAPWPEIIELANRITGFPRNMGTHCGGVIITPKPVKCYIPVQKAPKGVHVVQLEKDQAEDLGFIKLDILGNRSLAVIRDAIAAVKRNTGTGIDFSRINPANDLKTQQIIANGNTFGCFYIESPAMRQLLQKARTGKLEDLFILSSIIRPAANTFIREYIRRFRGGKHKPLHPIVEKVLEESLGIMVYEEHISQVAIALCDFSVADAEGLRKVFNRKDRDILLPRYKEMFFARARKNGVTREVIDQLWDMILSFSGYSFCKPHSASYALVSFQAAYLRAHYPAEFMAAVISNRGGFYSTFAYLSEARRMGLKILPVDINESEREYVGKGKHIRVGFMQLKGLSDDTIERILDERSAHGCFATCDECISRTNLYPADLEVLIKAGAFDALEGIEKRSALLWRVARMRASQQGVRPGQSGQTTLFANECKKPVSQPNLQSFNENALFNQEIETLGFLLSRHPLTFYLHRLHGKKIVQGKDLQKYVGKNVQVAGWYITGKPVLTKYDEPMEFLSFEDTTALIETTFFPKTYRRYCHLLLQPRPLLLSGVVQEEFGAVSLTVKRVENLTAKTFT